MMYQLPSTTLLFVFSFIGGVTNLSHLCGQTPEVNSTGSPLPTEAASGMPVTDANIADQLQATMQLPLLSHYRATELASVDQLVLVLSNATDSDGNRQEVLVFLGRTKNRGWETIGLADIEELAEHWRQVSQRALEPYHQAGLSSEQVEKVRLAVEVSIAQFQRVYHQLRNDFLDQPDQKSRLAVLAHDNRYDRLRQMGREGLFGQDSLVAKVINQALAERR